MASHDGVDDAVYEEEEYVGLPREVLETITNYSPNSSNASIPKELQWWWEYYVSRFDELINGIETSPCARLMQQAARALRGHVAELQLDLNQALIKHEQLRGELQEERGQVAHLDDENQELVEHVSTLATSNVQLALHRDTLLVANMEVTDASRIRLYYASVITIFLVLVILYVVIRYAIL